MKMKRNQDYRCTNCIHLGAVFSRNFLIRLHVVLKTFCCFPSLAWGCFAITSSSSVRSEEKFDSAIVCLEKNHTNIRKMYLEGGVVLENNSDTAGKHLPS